MKISRVVGPLALAGAEVAAQPAVHSPPIDCFMHARRSGLADSSAKQLCLGAISEEPAYCYDESTGIGALTDAQGVRLCAAATTNAPIRCLQSVIAGGEYVTADSVNYCAALQWPLVVPPYGGASTCLDSAQRVGISDAQSLDVCRGSTSDAPAQCVAVGREVTGLTDADLIQLCTTYAPIQVGYGPGVPYG